MFKVEIVFKTSPRRFWSVKKEFRNDKDMNLFIDRVCSKKGYLLDEVHKEKPNE